MTDVPTSVYKYVDRAERLIYVGITSRGITRQLEHNQHADWWKYVTGQTVEHFDTRAEAAARETELIRAHHPPFNTSQNDRWVTVRPAYLALVTAERAYACALTGDSITVEPCGHCPSCLDPAEHEWGPCQQQRPLEDREIYSGYESCPHCGRAACIWLLGHETGAIELWMDLEDGARLKPTYAVEARLRGRSAATSVAP